MRIFCFKISLYTLYCTINILYVFNIQGLFWFLFYYNKYIIPIMKIHRQVNHMVQKRVVQIFFFTIYIYLTYLRCIIIILKFKYTNIFKITEYLRKFLVLLFTVAEQHLFSSDAVTCIKYSPKSIKRKNIKINWSKQNNIYNNNLFQIFKLFIRIFCHTAQLDQPILVMK